MTDTIPTEPDLIFKPNFIDYEQSLKLMADILSETTFTSESYTFNGQTILTKRQISYHSELKYSYSTQTYDGKPWTKTLLLLKNIVEKATNETFNAVLCNYYENGDAGMGWHSDKEKELGDTPTIASISFGQERVFGFRYRPSIFQEKNPKTIKKIPLKSGDLLVMKNDTQQFFEHSLLKNKSFDKPRLNLTFRKIIT